MTLMEGLLKFPILIDEHPFQRISPYMFNPPIPLKSPTTAIFRSKSFFLIRIFRSVEESVKNEEPGN